MLSTYSHHTLFYHNEIFPLPPKAERTYGMNKKIGTRRTHRQELVGTTSTPKKILLYNLLICRIFAHFLVNLPKLITNITMNRLLPILFTAMFAAAGAYAQSSQVLSGTPIGSEKAEYSDGGPEVAFDGSLSTFYGSNARSNTWVGLDLGTKHVITRIAYAPRSEWAQRMQLGIFEGANNPDFTDAVPLHLIKKTPAEKRLTYATVNVSRGFRYVRYVGPNNVRCNVAELEFHGYAGNGDDTQFYTPTNLPVVVINTDGAKTINSKEVYLPAIISVISKSGKNFYSDSLEIRGRGNASWGFPKKPYKLKLAKKKKLLDMPAKAKQWTLINNYGDKTLMRNALAFKISEAVGMDYTPACRMVDVILNGEYQGTYQLCDQIEVRKNRVDITEMETEDNSGSKLTGGYLLEIDGYADQEKSKFTTSPYAYSLPVTIKSPDDDDITTQQHNYISSYFNKMATRLAGNLYLSPENGYRKFLDPESFLKYFIVNELSGNTDAYWSVYMYKDRDSTRFRTGPVWDFDLAFENDSRIHPVSDISTFLYASPKSSCAGNMRGFVGRVIGVEKERLKEVWSKARYDRGLTAEYLTHIIDSLQSELEESQKLNFIRWPIMNQIVHQEYQCAGSFEKEVQVVRDYLAYRLPWMDSMIGMTPVGVKGNKIGGASITAVPGGIRIDGTAYAVVAKVYDTSGIEVARTKVDHAGKTISLARGIYIVKVETDGETLKNKIVVR